MNSTRTEAQAKELLQKATQHIKDEDFDDAISALKEILDQQPRHEIALGMLAAIYLQIGMQEQAIERYETLLSTHPDNPLARFQLGMAQLSLGRPEQALGTWKPMLALENEFMAHFHSALALIQLGRQREALDLLVEASRHMPSSHPLYPQLLELHAQLTENEDATP